MPTARRPRRALFKVLTGLLLLLLLEAAVRVSYALVGALPPTEDESLEREWRWAQQHLAQGTAVLRSRFVFDPLVGWRNAPGLREDGITTNSAGMRGSAEYALERQPGKQRMVIVGDSYTFGENARDEETFPHLLEAGLLDDWEVLNLAVPGTGTDQQVIEFEHRGSRYGPDVAVLGFFVRDFNRNVLSFREYAKPMFVVEAEAQPDGLRLLHSPVIPPEALYDDYVTGRRRIGGSLLRCRTLSVLLTKARKLDEWTASPGVPAWDVLALLMARFQCLAREAGAVPVWLVIPYRDCLEADGSRMREMEDACERRARELGLACLRLDTAFRPHAAAEPDARIYRDDAEGGHLSAVGNRVAAEKLARLVRSLEVRSGR